jgi:hypothetical protein
MTVATSGPGKTKLRCMRLAHRRLGASARPCYSGSAGTNRLLSDLGKDGIVDV